MGYAVLVPVGQGRWWIEEYRRVGIRGEGGWVSEMVGGGEGVRGRREEEE